MSDGTTKKLLRPFIQLAPAPLFLAGFFQSPPENFHTSETVEIDIQRDGEEVAVAIKSLGAGRQYNENSSYSNKAFTPPIFKEVVALNAFQVISRDPGQMPFSDPGFQAKAMMRAARASAKVQNKIRRACELMASQVLQTGTVTCIDENGLEVAGLDFQPKSTHLKTVNNTWDANGTVDRFGDLEELAQAIRADGHTSPDVLVFGATAWRLFLKGSGVKDAVSRDGLGLGQLAPQRRGGTSATFQGYCWIGNYRFEMWTYDGRYTHPQTKVSTPYVANDKIIMLSSGARLDMTFGAIPRFVEPEGRVLPFMPNRVTDSGGSIDMTMGAWLSPDGETLFVSVGARPLAIPTEIDSFGCLDVVTG
jgi:hypothetical protein